MLTKDENDNIHPIFDRRGRQQFNMPKPINQVIHFNSAASKRIFNAFKDEIMAQVRSASMGIEVANKMLADALKKAAHMVPIYKGMDAKAFYPFNQTARAQRELQREALKKRLKEWANIKRIEA